MTRAGGTPAGARQAGVTRGSGAPAPDQRRLKYRVVQAALRLGARLLFGYKVCGLEHVPLTGPCLFAANHKSYLDPPLLGACLPREIRYFAKKELFKVPLLGPLIRVYGAIPVDREGFDRKGLATALELLSRGEWLLVFPEGTRIRRPGLAQPKEGVGLLAVRTGAPVVPAYLSSTWEPRRRLWRRIPIRIRFGAPLRFDQGERGAEARGRYRDAAAAVLDAVRELGATEIQD